MKESFPSDVSRSVSWPFEKRIAVETSPLDQILEEVSTYRKHQGERRETQRALDQRNQYISAEMPSVCVEDSGCTVRLGELSPGCRACKSGTWDCLFMTMACNLKCDFCLTPGCVSSPPALSTHGEDLHSLCEKYAVAGTQGVGISGGEPFLKPGKVVDTVRALKESNNDIYVWIYTNGTLVNEDLLRELCDLGLDELRFNLAATSFSDEHVHNMLVLAAQMLPAVTVEIPALPSQEEHILGALPKWATAGVRYLNLHELIYQDGSPSGEMAGARSTARLPDGHACGYNPDSAKLALRVMQTVEAEGLGIHINFCTLGGKVLQMQGRRRALAGRTLRPQERIDETGYAESRIFFNRTELRFEPPEDISRYGIALLRRILPVFPDAPDQWVDYEIIREAP